MECSKENLKLLIDDPAGSFSDGLVIVTRHLQIVGVFDHFLQCKRVNIHLPKKPQ